MEPPQCEYELVTIGKLLPEFATPNNAEELRLLLEKWNLGACYNFFIGMFLVNLLKIC